MEKEYLKTKLSRKKIFNVSRKKGHKHITLKIHKTIYKGDTSYSSYYMKCPKCETVLASRTILNKLPEFTTCSNLKKCEY